MADEWYYQLMGETVGPVRLAKLKSLVGRGDITEETLLRGGAESEWQSAWRFDWFEAARLAPTRVPAAGPRSAPERPAVPRQPSPPAAPSEERRNYRMIAFARARRFMAQTVAVPVWALVLASVAALSIASVAVYPYAKAATKEPESLFHLATQVDAEDLSDDFFSRLAVNTIRSHIELNADDPSSIEWVEFRHAKMEYRPKYSTWVVWYRARNRFGALELFRVGALLETFRDSDGEMAVNPLSTPTIIPK